MSAEDDAQHLRLLSIFHYVVAGLTAALSSVFLIHAGLGLTMLLRPGWLNGKNQADSVGGWLFFAMGSAAVILGWSLAAAIGFAGRFLAQRRRYTFCLVVASVEAGLCSPFGTVLGIFTIVVLLRPSVKEAFKPPLAPALRSEEVQ
jgi:hypothetical protein